MAAIAARGATKRFMLPSTLALIDDDKEFCEFLALYLRDLGVDVAAFSDSNDLLAHSDAYSYDFYVVDLTLDGIDGVDLIKLLRRRTDVGLLVLSGRLVPDVFKQVITAGADMYLAKPVHFDQVAIAVEAVQRRAVGAAHVQPIWKLDRRAGQLVAPDGARIDLSGTDQALMECFLEAAGETVSRETLKHRLGHDTGAEISDGLNATIYRLRRRIERATPIVVPLQTKSRVGYRFRAPLQLF